MVKKFDELLEVKNAYKYNLKINREYINYLENEELGIIIRIFKTTQILNMDKDILFQLEGING